MNQPDEHPTTPLNSGSPASAATGSSGPAPSRARLGRRGRVAASGIAAAVLIAAGVGIGMAAADSGNHTEDMSQPHSSHHGAHSAKTGTVDPARQRWAHTYGQDRTAMPNLPDVAAATPEQRAAAADLLARTESATAVYADTGRAQAAGFDIQASLARAERKNPHLAQRLQQIDADRMPATMPMIHVAAKANRSDGKVLDPTAPETLMYAYQGHDAWKLVGVMYTATESYPQAPPDPGGPITRWHYHDENGGATLMMHVFFVPGNDLAHAYALTMDTR